MPLADRIMMYAIPGFFVLMAIEWIVARIQRRRVYRFSDYVNSLSLGTISQIVGVFTKAISIGIYAWSLQHLALFHPSARNPLAWIGGMLMYDFCYYWLHRLGHETHILWAAHVVHHQSERYNLGTALRQTGSGVLLGWIFYLPLAVVGIPVEVYAVLAVVDLLAQYWIHTETVPKLGWFDRVFASPSNHRVHHAVNDKYLDKNYGGILMLWDRLFGTFIDEDDNEPVVYGTRSPLRSWNPLWANAEVYWGVLKDAWRAEKWSDKVRIWFKPPGWRPADVAARFPKPEFDIRRAEYDPPVSRWHAWHAGLVFVVLLALGTGFLKTGPQLPLANALAYALFLVGSLTLVGALLEGRRLAPWLQAGWLLGWGGGAALLGRWVDGSAVPAALRIAVAAALAVGVAMLALGAMRKGDAGSPMQAVRG